MSDGSYFVQKWLKVCLPRAVGLFHDSGFAIDEHFARVGHEIVG